MAKEEQVDIETLKDRGLSCPKLKRMIDNKLKDAKDFRAVGFNNIANAEETNAKKIRALQKKVCLLK